MTIKDCNGDCFADSRLFVCRAGLPLCRAAELLYNMSVE